MVRSEGNQRIIANKQSTPLGNYGEGEGLVSTSLVHHVMAGYE